MQKAGRKPDDYMAGFDGFDYSFQIDYVSYWNRIVKAFRDVCDYSKVPVSIEYKPYEERVHALLTALELRFPFSTMWTGKTWGDPGLLPHADEEGESWRLQRPGCWSGGNSTIYISTTERVPRMTA